MMRARTRVAVLDGPVNELTGPRPGRYRYVRRGPRQLTYVILDVFPDGREDAAEQESGELRWHPVDLPSEERSLVLSSLEPDATDGWPCLFTEFSTDRR